MYRGNNLGVRLLEAIRSQDFPFDTQSIMINIMGEAGEDLRSDLGARMSVAVVSARKMAKFVLKGSTALLPLEQKTVLDEIQQKNLKMRNYDLDVTLLHLGLPEEVLCNLRALYDALPRWCSALKKSCRAEEEKVRCRNEVEQLTKEDLSNQIPPIFLYLRG